MKNHAINFEKSKTFILNYEVKDNNIIIHFASGEDYSIPYTEENEKRILVKMEQQIHNSEELIEKYQHKIKSNKNNLFGYITCLIALTLFPDLISSAFGFHSIYNIVNMFLLALGGPGSIANIYFLVSNKSKINDVRKSVILIENQEKLNESAKSNNHNILANTSKKLKEMVSSTPTDKPTFTINSIHLVKYRELKQLIENIQFAESFNFEYPDSSIQQEKQEEHVKINSK